jgi:hypothetical protein
MRFGIAVLPLAVACLAAMAGCNVEVNKGSNGEEKDVKIATPFGGINVRTNQISAEDLGLAEYPGSRLSNDSKGDRSANVDMGFGGWRLHVKAVNYQTADSRDKVIDFYRKVLSMYGDVIECDGAKAIGSPTATSQGLSCGDSEGGHGNRSAGGSGLELKAGSHQYQHLVVFKNGDSAPETEFALVAIDLPRDLPHGRAVKRQTN